MNSTHLTWVELVRIADVKRSYIGPLSMKANNYLFGSEISEVLLKIENNLITKRENFIFD